MRAVLRNKEQLTGAAIAYDDVLAEEVKADLPPVDLNQGLALLICHAGFEGVSTRALEVLTDVMTAYIIKLGNLLHLHEDAGPRPPSHEVVQRCLDAMGRESLQQMSRYVKGLSVYADRLLLIEQRLHERVTRESVHWEPQGKGEPEVQDAAGKLDDVEITEADMEDITGGTMPSLDQDKGEESASFVFAQAQ
jgi:hypothetical protein